MVIFYVLKGAVDGFVDKQNGIYEKNVMITGIESVYNVDEFVDNKKIDTDLQRLF